MFFNNKIDSKQYSTHVHIKSLIFTLSWRQNSTPQQCYQSHPKLGSKFVYLTENQDYFRVQNVNPNHAPQEKKQTARHSVQATNWNAVISTTGGQRWWRWVSGRVVDRVCRRPGRQSSTAGVGETWRRDVGLRWMDQRMRMPLFYGVRLKRAFWCALCWVVVILGLSEMGFCFVGMCKWRRWLWASVGDSLSGYENKKWRKSGRLAVW